ncbi:MAG: biotin--[acetyl-CoA-carboxylase] ligase [Bacteroidetes bacterium]|nr:biotin--[acetyl-CoA-carboxylase] ligase [Bacteroidota bacterium]
MIYNTLFTGKFLIHEPSMGSTNTFAQDVISKTKPIDGTVILTDDQCQGKGQAGNVWQSEAGKNLTCSVIYDSSFLEVKHQYFLNMTVAVSLVEALAGFLDVNALSIKWPNDILFNNRKLGGILIENSVQGSFLRHSVIGIGLNVNQAVFNELPHATSVMIETGTHQDIGNVLNAVCENLERRYLQLKANGGPKILNHYNELLYKRGSLVTFIQGSDRFKAVVLGVDQQGRLILDQNEETTAFRFGEVKWQYEYNK